jgi:hypothetical protein
MSQPTPSPASAPEAAPDLPSAHRPATRATGSPRVAIGGRDLSIAVIGGSLVGPAAELFLRRAGFRDVTTYEAMPRAHSQSGGVMGLRAPTVELLEQIGLDRDRIVALPDPAVHGFDIDGGRVSARGTSMFPGQVTSWDALYAALSQRVEVVHGHRLTRLCTTDGRYALGFANGYEREADVVLFADGRKSAGRVLLDPARRLTYNGYVVWRGLVDTPTPEPRGFNRFFDIAGGRLFSLCSPSPAGWSAPASRTWEFSHNLPEAGYTRVAGGRGPTDHAYILSQQVGPAARSVIAAAAHGMPELSQELIAGGTVSGIPVNDGPVPQRALWTAAGSSADGRCRWCCRAARRRTTAGPAAGRGGSEQRTASRRVVFAQPCHTFNAGPVRVGVVHAGPVRPVDRAGTLAGAPRNNLGWYIPVRPGYTAAPTSDQWSEPTWVTP